MNAAAIASVHVGVIAWQQSRTTEQRTELHSGFIGLCLGAVAAFLILRAQHRAIDQCPWVKKAKLSDSSAGGFQIRNVQRRSWRDWGSRRTRVSADFGSIA
jgi:hypothetical protein